MAWTTSAGLRARSSLASLSVTRLKPARLWAELRRPLSRVRPVLFLSLSAVSLGLAAPLLPTSLLTAILLLTGVALAMLATGANLAGTIAATQAHAEHHDPKAAPARAHHAAPAHHLARPQRHRHAPAHHDWAELMARVHHELRTPLNAVIGFSEIMALEMFGPLGNERYQDYARYIQESAGDLLKSAEDTLALTTLLTAAPRTREPAEATTLTHAIDDACALIERKAAARGVRLDLTVASDAQVLCEPRALRQILVNMLSEGIARASAGSHISLLAVADGELLEIVVSAARAQPIAAPRAGSLSICLARTLLEMQGTSLLEIESAGGGWSAVTVLDRAVQPDFFAGLLSTQAPRYQPAMAI